ncbi:hypothetical protein Pint_10999 [Pistacia integerrima]|uniref:Uncharacterized protein n=1 Tax=Pistacia integerrima TaxID=434235 RepID=A0ACC0XH53_9ROSI|nr:hypothetical protein Pint_10999 [Pistacia integerrima]
MKTFGISENEDYPLHVAVKENYSSCLRELVDLMQSDELAIENRSGNTAFFIAAAMGRVEHAELMFEKNEKLTSIRGEKEMLPIHIAAQGGHERMVESLYKVQGRLEEMDSKKLFDYSRINENIKKLYRAALRNDLNTTITDVFKKDPKNIPLYLTTKISDNHDIALYVATASESAVFVRELVNKMEKKDLAIQNCDGCTAFFLAAASGRVEPVKLMFGKNTELPSIRGHDEMLPIHIAAQGDYKEMVTYLYGVTKDKLTEDDLIGLLHDLIARVDLFDVALNLLDEYPSLATKSLMGRTALHVLAGAPMMSRDSANQIQQGILKRCFNLFSGSKKLPHEKLPWKALKLAKLLLDKVDCRDNRIQDTRGLLFRNAVLKRQKDIFKLLINNIGPSFTKKLLKYKDPIGNNILHLAGMSASSDQLDTISGVALQLQHELLWFKEVSTVVNPLDTQAKNASGKTPKALFDDTHEDLKGKGEKWMKDTANSCMVVATLIATVVFSAAFRLPGGTKKDSATPYLFREVSFTIFFISDGISLVLSVCSILTFLSILTSRYAEKDFLLVLPTKLVVGLSTLLLSIAAMMVVFCATIFIVFKDGKIWVPIFLSLIASVPVIVFVKQQWPLLVDVARSNYEISSHFDNEGNARKRNMLWNKDDNGGCWSYFKERCGYYKSKCHKLS